MSDVISNNHFIRQQWSKLPESLFVLDNSESIDKSNLALDCAILHINGRWGFCCYYIDLDNFQKHWFEVNFDEKSDRWTISINCIQALDEYGIPDAIACGPEDYEALAIRKIYH